MTQLTFYTNPMSRGQIVRWALEETGVKYDQQIIEYGEQMNSGDYLSINPMGKVPAIKHGDKIVTECAAICCYLADTFSERTLAPAMEDRADYYRWMFFGAGPLESAVTNKSLGFETDDEQRRMAGYGTYDLVVKVLDEMLGKHDYVCGAQFTMADVYVGSQVDWGIMFKTLPETDNFKAYAARLRERDAYKSAKKIDMALMPKST